MSLVQVKQKYQVTIPIDVRVALDLKEGDLLDAQVQDGAVLLVPQSISDKGRDKAERFMSYFGAAKGLFASPEEVDAFIRKERDAWDD